MKTKLILLAIVLAMAPVAQLTAAETVLQAPVPFDSPVKVTAEIEKRLVWWREAKFGLFIHWGLYAIPGKGEWVMWSNQMNVSDYAKLADQFSASKFSGKAWVKAAKDAGMKYMVMVTKHHDGFAMFDSKADPFNAMNSAAHRDFVKDYADAAHEAGMHVGFYYSPLDWRFPGYFFPDLYRDSAEAMREKYHRQVTELMTHYGTIDILWYDGGGSNWLAFGGVENGGRGWRSRDRSKAYSGKFDWQDNAHNSQVRKLQPNLIINNRTDAPGDFAVREGGNNLGGFDNQTPWELCLTLAGPWGYRPGAKPMSLEQCIRTLVNAVGRDGNLLLNVGPRPDGEIEPDQVARLKEIGQWLEKNGESIYGTRGGPYLPLEQKMVSTRKGNRIFLHLIDWPAPGNEIRLKSPGASIKAVALIDGKPVRFEDAAGRLVLKAGPEIRQPLDTIIVLEVDGSAMDLPLIPPL